MKKIILGLATIALVGAGCLGGGPEEVADATCDAYLTDASITSEEDRGVFRGLCYLEKAVEAKNVNYCLSLEGFERGDCISYVASDEKKVEYCDTYFKKSETMERSDCLSLYAVANDSLEACDLVDEGIRGYCVEGVDGCRAGTLDEIECKNSPGAHLYCDALDDSSLIKKCETAFPIGAYDTYR